MIFRSESRAPARTAIIIQNLDMKFHVRCEEIFLSPGSSFTFLKALVEWRLLSELRFCLGESGLQTAAEVGEAVR